MDCTDDVMSLQMPMFFCFQSIFFYVPVNTVNEYPQIYFCGEIGKISILLVEKVPYLELCITDKMKYPYMTFLWASGAGVQN